MVVLFTATLAGCADEKRSAVRVDVLLRHVRKAFGDDILRSASVKGSTLTVTVAFPHHPLSEARVSFEAQMLAAAVHDSDDASGRTPIDLVKVVGSNGRRVNGAGASVVDDSSLGPLPAGKCKVVAETVTTALFLRIPIRSARTVPYAGGACAFTFQSPTGAFDPPELVGALDRGMGDPNDRPIFVEVDDRPGTPWFVQSWTAGGGGTEGATPASGVLIAPAGPSGPHGPTGRTGPRGPTGRTGPSGPAWPARL